MSRPRRATRPKQRALKCYTNVSEKRGNAMLIKRENSYRLETNGRFCYVVVLDCSHCPVCQTKLLLRATRQRVLYRSEEEKEILLIRRLYCTKCNQIHHELPDCIVPYKRYSAEVIERATNGDARQDACSESTAARLRNWLATIKPYFLHILRALVSRHGVVFGTPPTFKETVRAVVNSNSWIFANQICTCSVLRPQ